MRAGDKFALTLDAKTFLDKPYDIYSEQGAFKGSFKPYDLIIGLGAEYYITDALSAGLTLRSVTSALAEKNKGSSFCGDIFVRYGGEKWGVELAGRNIGTKISYGSDSYAIPSLVFKDIAFARAGFHYGDPAKALPAFLSLGIGGKYAGFRLDGTFLLLSETLGNTFLVSLGYEF